MNFPMIVLLCFVCCLFSCRVTKDRRTLTEIVVMGRTYKRRSKLLEATAHGRDFADIETRPQLRALVRRKIFERYLFLSNRNGTGTIEGLCDREGKMIAEEEKTMKKEEEA